MQFITRLKVGFIETRGGESLEVTKEDSKATRSDGMGLEFVPLTDSRQRSSAQRTRYTKDYRRGRRPREDETRSHESSRTLGKRLR